MSAKMKTSEIGYDIDILVQGYPGKAVCHGGLGWSTVVLIRGHGHNILVDTGGFGMRGLLQQKLDDHGLKPRNISHVLLTHSHYDHSVNWTMFPNARIFVGKIELEWALSEPWGTTPVPELYVEKLNDWPTLIKLDDGDEVLSHISAFVAPGHTPGCLVFVLSGQNRDLIFTGDAAKNRAELVSRNTDMTYDPAISRDTIEMIWKLWEQRSGSIVIPGHDVPLAQENGVIRKLGEHEAAIKSWSGDDMETTTLYRLFEQ
jgi:N-acyl homoserine lactone hydrolase